MRLVFKEFNMSRRWIIFLLLAARVLPADDHRAQKQLESRVADYMELRGKVAAGLPELKPKAEPEEIRAHKQALLKAIRSARTGAKQGDILQPEIATYLRETVRSEMKGPDGKPAKETAKQGNPKEESPAKPVPVQVNAIYPESAPASTVPPSLLLRLPELPKAVDFRFVGRHLVLRDVDAGLILDFIPNVVP
jgi:hypothetical protein